MPADRQIHMGIKRLRNCVQNNISELIFTLHTPLEHQIKICVGRNCSCELQCLQCQCLESNGRVIVPGSGGVFWTLQTLQSSEPTMQHSLFNFCWRGSGIPLLQSEKTLFKTLLWKSIRKTFVKMKTSQIHSMKILSFESLFEKINSEFIEPF